jgi:uncharacterized protein YdaU (DUF1376 family)
VACLPYFKFYPGDWLSDATVRRMPLEARGLYWELLAIAWKEGGIPDDPSQLAGWLGLTPKRFERLWPHIEECWVHGKNGHLVNPRQEKERKEAEDSHRRRVEAGRKGGKANA